ncbi:MAG TPA: hypothetical protein VF131_28710 [Blastocatellia bacterium]|nr:hypothetical protein [Blastocatellia bacterium]
MKNSSDSLQKSKPAQVEIDLVARNMADAFIEAVMLREQDKGYLRTYFTREQMGLVDPDQLRWHNLSDAELDNDGAAQVVWEHVKVRAREELRSGMLAAMVVAENQAPIAYGRFLARREALIEDWQPRGGQEMQLVETLAQLQVLQDHWMQICVQRMMFDAQEESRKIKRNGKWEMMPIGKDALMEQAHEMLGQVNAMCLRTMRALRDLRRYSAQIIINNPRTVNVAQDHATQTNVQKRTARKKRGKKVKQPRPTKQPLRVVGQS